MRSWRPSGLARRAAGLMAAGTLLLMAAACGGGPSERAASPTPPTPVASSAQQEDADVAFLEARAASDPLDTFGLNGLAQLYLQRTRETGDVSNLSRAGEALRQSLERRPSGNYDAVALSASLKITQHDFAAGADLAREAIAEMPNAAYGYGALGDADLGLGRYDDARVAYQRMHELEPGMSSLTRLALLEQVYGRYDSALDLWQQALATGEATSVPEHQAWIESQIANNRFITGDIGAADEAYARSLAAFPHYVHALAGLGRTAAAREDYATAIDFYRKAIDVQPLPEYVTALGDVYAVSGDDAAAQDQYALVGAIEQLYAANGVRMDLQIALFNADHGRELAETASRAQALYAVQPSIQAADALAWAQFQAGHVDTAKAAIEAALATGSGEPLFLYHAGEIYRAAGDDGQALSYFQRLGASNPRFSPLHAQAAADALDALSAQAQSRGL